MTRIDEKIDKYLLNENQKSKNIKDIMTLVKKYGVTKEFADTMVSKNNELVKQIGKMKVDLGKHIDKKKKEEIAKEFLRKH